MYMFVSTFDCMFLSSTSLPVSQLVRDSCLYDCMDRCIARYLRSQGSIGACAFECMYLSAYAYYIHCLLVNEQSVSLYRDSGRCIVLCLMSEGSISARVSRCVCVCLSVFISLPVSRSVCNAFTGVRDAVLSSVSGHGV